MKTRKTSLPQEPREPYLLLKEQRVQGLPAGQDHHGEAHGHRHHEASADHLRHQVGGEVHQHVAGDGLGEAHVAKEPHLPEDRAEGRMVGRALPQRGHEPLTAASTRPRRPQIPGS